MHIKTIWKYTINESDLTRLELPKEAIPRSVGVDMYGLSSIWFEVETDNSKEFRFFYGRGTGMAIDCIEDADLGYIGTINDEGFMWHIYEVRFYGSREWNEERGE